MWHGRFTQDMDDLVCKFTQSLDLDWRMILADIRGSIAHVRMLSKVGLITNEEKVSIEKALKEIASDAEKGILIPAESLEDVHMNVESQLIERIGDIGAKLHTGRSRNDQANVTVRIYMREKIIDLWELMSTLLQTLLIKAEEHKKVIIPGYTHMQQAQPISMGHFWMAHYQSFIRDAERLLRAYESFDESPLGAGALAGTTLPVDRYFTAEDLGFSKVTENSMDSVASRDHIIDFHHFASVFGIHASRLSEDLIIYFTSEFGWLKIPDAFCTGSSMMPQKKNPDVLEIIRGKAGQLIGSHVDSLVMIKGTPLTFNRDFQEDKRGLWNSYSALELILGIMPPLLSEVQVDSGIAKQGFKDGFIFATDVAEHLVERGVPFRKAHEIVGGIVSWCTKNDRTLTSLTLQEWKELAPQASDELPSLLTPEKSVERRNTVGGTSSQRLSEQIEHGKEKLKNIDEKFTSYKRKLPVL